ncbi:hypothetical protein GCM10022393_43280 [Aquimarina addita]|uniref:Fibronectin type-III domain-containing protein n=1 Tax=Aquimarina addita TaxID=870485 RepID=A0ABP6UXT4_9FLAO
MIKTLTKHRIILFTLLFSLFLISCSTDDDEPLVIEAIKNPNNDVTSSSYQSGTLTFTPGQNTPSSATYKIYLDTNEDPTTVYNLSTNSYNYSNLKANSTYYWKVETIDNTGTVLATSSVFNFITGLIYNGTLSLTQEQIDTFEYTKVIGNLFIHGFDNNSITNLNGLSSLSSVEGNLQIWVNDNLESLEGLEALTTLGGDLHILENPILKNLMGLNGITSIGGNLILSTNNTLISLDGLNNLASVEGEVTVNRNDDLTSFDDLDAITSIGGYLNIWENDNLINLNGLETLTALGGNLYIGTTTNPRASGVGNNILFNLCGVSQLIINGQITSEEYFVRSNAYNPTYIEIQTTGSGGCQR